MSRRPKKPKLEDRPKRVSPAKLRDLYEEVLRLRELFGKRSKPSKRKDPSSPSPKKRSQRTIKADKG
ncbi:hypothetical protein NB311A_10218 [Nitrobacter sp. Nb-311A]|nr:hypothetical protein NB311A_10218 [Nitrobacter sp. Nb-311A]